MSSSCSNIQVCKAKFPSRSRCPDCDGDLGYPNVRAAQDGFAALQQRYDEAIEANAAARDKIREFGEEVSQVGQVVISVPYDFAIQFLKSSSALYANYHCLVDKGARLPAAPTDHQRRVDADNQMFPAYEKDISFGALSLDHLGVWSYGPCHIGLSIQMTSHRTSFSHANTFRYQRWFEPNSGPDGHQSWREKPGYRSDWEQRAKLAVAKLASGLRSDTPRSDFSGLLLQSDGDRSKDEFIEAHVFGPISHRAAKFVRVPTDAQSKRFDPARTRTELNSKRKEIEACVEAILKLGTKIDYECRD